MHTTMSRLARAAVAAGAVVLTVSGVMVVQAPAASAGGCSAGLVCGAVKNRTGRLMSFTTDLDANPAHGSGYCDVWNWNGGTGESFYHAGCSQQGMGNGTVGGLGTGTDVDAFSFNGEGYHERFSRVGTWHWRTRGVWTKVRDPEIADCGIGDGNEIWCTVLVQ